MSSHQEPNHYRTSFECVDKDQASVPGSGANTHGAVFYHVEANCNGIACPPYNSYKELNCAMLCAPNKLELIDIAIECATTSLTLVCQLVFQFEYGLELNVQYIN